jgi:hypothetical protein
MSLLDALSDRLNPIVLQEVRRGLRTRVFSVVFTLLLLACTLAALIAFGTYDQGRSGEHGKVTFFFFFFCLATVGFFMLPYSAYRSLVREREDRTWPLLVLTGLTSRRILAGKIGSWALQAGLYASVIAPFLLFAYLLQGISLVVVGTLLVAAVSWHLFLTVAAVAAATLGETRMVRAALHFAVLGALLFSFIAGFSAATSMTTLHAPDLDFFLRALGVALWFMLAYGLVLFAVAVSRLTFESDNHAFWPHLALLFHFAGTTALCYGVVLTGHRHVALGLWLGLGGAAHALVAGLFCASGRPGTSRRLVAHPPRLTLLGLLMPGAARGLRFAALLVVLFMAAGLGLATLEDGFRMEKEHCAILGAGALALLYLALPVALGRGVLRRWMPAPAYLQVLGALLAIAAMGVPPIVALVADLKVDHAGMNYLNPVIAVGQIHDQADWARALILWSLASAIFWAAHRISGERDREAGGG